MDTFKKNFNKPNSNKKNYHFYNSEQNSNNINLRDPQSKISEYTNKYQDKFGYILNHSDLDLKNVFSEKSHRNSKEDFYDYEYDLTNYSNKFVMDKNSFSKNIKNSTERKQDLRKLNPNIKKNPNNSDGELEINLPFESFGAQKRSKIIENISYKNSKNFPTLPSYSNEQNIEQKINYRLQKKIKKGEVDDEVEIINSYAKENVKYLPIEEYGT